MEPEQKSVGQHLLEATGDAAAQAAFEGCFGCLFNGISAIAVIFAVGLWVFW